MPTRSARNANLIPAAEAETMKYIEATVTLLQAGQSRAVAGFEATQAEMQQSVAKALKTAEELVAFNHGDVEAIVSSGEIWATSVQDMSRHIATAAQASLDDSMAAFKALGSVKSLKDAFALQSVFARSALQEAQTETLTDGSVARTKQAPNPIVGGMTGTGEQPPNATPQNVDTSRSAPLSGTIQAVLAVCARWDIPDDLGAVILGSAHPGFVSELRSGETTLATRDMQDRARLFFDIYEGVFGLLRSPAAEREWIRMPRPEFEGRSLLDLMTEGSQRNLIRGLGFVDFVNGR